MKRLLLILSMTFLLFPITAFSTTIDAVSAFEVNTSQLTGMDVTMNFASPAGQVNTTWDYDGSFSGVSGGSGDTSWSLSFASGQTPDITDNLGRNWSLATGSGIAVNSFTINAYGDSLSGAHNFFDIIYDADNHGTTESHVGFWYDIGDAYTTTVDKVAGLSTYDGTTFHWEFTDPVNINGEAPVGDLYTTLTIDFINLDDGDPNTADTTGTAFSGNGEDVFTFGVDTDIENPVPEPATMLLFGIGLLGFSAVSRKKRII